MRGGEPTAHGLSRREVIGRGTALGLVDVHPCRGTAAVDQRWRGPRREGGGARRRSSPAVLRALVARLVPADANGPSGVDAGAAAYIEKALGGALKDLAALYNNGLTAIDAYATATRGAAFAALAPDAAGRRHRRRRAGSGNGSHPGSVAFFRALKEHALQGMFGDPVYGGNKELRRLGPPGLSRRPDAGAGEVPAASAWRCPKAHMSTYADGAVRQGQEGGPGMSTRLKQDRRGDHRPGRVGRLRVARARPARARTSSGSRRARGWTPTTSRWTRSATTSATGSASPKFAKEMPTWRRNASAVADRTRR